MKLSIDRDGFQEAIRASVQSCPTGSQLAVIAISLRNMHRLNVLAGYAEVDVLLRKVRDSIDTQLRKATNVTRIGDTKIGLIIPDLSSPNLALVALDRALEAARLPFEVGDQRIRLEAHAGAALYPAHTQTASQLMIYAESAMHAAGKSGEDSVLHSSIIEEATLEAWSLEDDLSKALAERELFLHYQPQLDLRSHQIIGCEALMRWRHPVRGLVSPEQFISLAESTSLITVLTEWALQTALREISSLADVGLELSVAVNISPSSLFHPEFSLMVDSALSIWDMAPQRLIIEITESVLMADPQACIRILSEMRAKGIRVSIDDFGTGYSSLAYFKTIPADELKIDRSFVLNMLESASDASIVELVIDLAHKFGLKVVAEGVENEALQRVLEGLGCDLVQGYHLSRPMSLEDLQRWLLAYSPTSALPSNG